MAMKQTSILDTTNGLLTSRCRAFNMTTGQVYQNVIARERHGEYLGKTIQIIPHITGAIKQKIKETAAQAGADFLLVEIGGTVGDIGGERAAPRRHTAGRHSGARRSKNHQRPS